MPRDSPVPRTGAAKLMLCGDMLSVEGNSPLGTAALQENAEG